MIVPDPAIQLQRLIVDLEAALAAADEQAILRAYRQLLAAHDAGHVPPDVRNRIDFLYGAWLSKRLVAGQPDVKSGIRRARSFPVSEIMGPPLSELIIKDRG